MQNNRIDFLKVYPCLHKTHEVMNIHDLNRSLWGCQYICFCLNMKKLHFMTLFYVHSICIRFIYIKFLNMSHDYNFITVMWMLSCSFKPVQSCDIFCPYQFCYCFFLGRSCKSNCEVLCCKNRQSQPKHQLNFSRNLSS